jgi:hypothetical protein
MSYNEWTTGFFRIKMRTIKIEIAKKNSRVNKKSYGDVKECTQRKCKITTIRSSYTFSSTTDSTFRRLRRFTSLRHAFLSKIIGA